MFKSPAFYFVPIPFLLPTPKRSDDWKLKPEETTSVQGLDAISSKCSLRPPMPAAVSGPHGNQGYNPTLFHRTNTVWFTVGQIT